MTKVIRNLIRDRTLKGYMHKVVDVTHVGGRPISKCHDNAADEMELHRNPDGTCDVKVVAGWLVGNWNGSISPFLPHYWNYDQRTKRFYDTTASGYFPFNDGVTYLIDDEVQTLSWGDIKGFLYNSNNKPYMVGKRGNKVLINNFTNANVKLLSEQLSKEIA